MNYTEVRKTKRIITRTNPRKIIIQRWYCELCGIGGTGLCGMSNHILAGHIKGTTECSCGQRFNSSFELMRHVQYLHINKLYTCNICNQQYNNAVYMELHIDNHLRETKTNDRQNQVWACTVCGLGGIGVANIIDHLITHHMNHNNEKQCNCGQIFNHYREMIEHVARSHISHNYLCMICNHPCPDETAMTIHMMEHQNAASTNKQQDHKNRK